MSAIVKSGARSSGPSGCIVPGWSGGGGGDGRSATMLYQARGMRSSSSTNLVRLFVMRGSPGVAGWKLPGIAPSPDGATRLQRDARVSQGAAVEGHAPERHVAGRAPAQEALEENDPVHGPGRVEQGRRRDQGLHRQ